ncbi:MULTISPECIES: thiolase family protein [Bacillaceae]|uniref:thiolase family protein n=1 Tax=Bacillaceae TaxID=186817 RepID=UPI000BFD93E3|nr:MULTISPECIES: thiolase family protein [Bacillaceae]PGT91589.1 acetyl-CoA C-acyltransferase [Bacillus sp. AFS040349]UGB28993.1 thiolase family protein [Metabacillus sp. B2-18]
MIDDIVIVSAIRTPVGRFGGSLKNVNSGYLGAIVIEEAIRRINLSSELIDEVILGEVRQTTESSNVARVAALRAGIPEKTPAFTVNRLCASGMQAVTSAVQQISFGQAEIVVAGGTECLSRAPIYLRNSRFGEGAPTLVDSNLENGQQPIELYGKDLGMGMTAENVAERYSVSREDQDEFAYNSQQKAAKATERGSFKEEITPVEIKERKNIFQVTKDEHPRPNTSLEGLAKLKAVFKEHGSVTAGNSCGRNDGAAAMVMMKGSKAKELGLKPLARIVDWATAGVSPKEMGIGPVPAIQKLLARTNLTLPEVGLIELNEAFAAQALAVIREARLDTDKVNVNGGAIALGHPLGATGCKIMITLLYEMKRRQEQYGMATLCVGGGQGMAVMLELL